jgi:hypothetical protein
VKKYGREDVYKYTSQLALRTQEQRFVNHMCVKNFIRIRRNAPYVHKKRINTYEKKKYSNTSQRDERAVNTYVNEVYEYTNTSQKVIRKKYERALNHYVGEEK